MIGKDTVTSVMFGSRHTPCPECGASIQPSDGDHVCDEERRLDYQLFQLRDEVAAFDDDLHQYLDSPSGRFARWCAERERGDDALAA
jgi:hypothetical protein